MSYDLHRHLWPDALVERLRARTTAPCLRDGTLVGVDGEHPVDVEAYGLGRCIASLDRDGFEVGVVSCPPTLGIEAHEDLLEAYHEGARAAVAASGGRLLAFSLARPEPGFTGTTVSALDLVDLDALAPVLDALAAQGGVLFVHPGPSRPPDGAPSWWTAGVGYTAQMQAAYASWLAHGIDRWPALKVLFAILAGGGPIQLERLRSRGFDIRRALHPTLYLDTASYGHQALELCLATYGGSRLVFGSDAPVLDARLSLDGVRSFGQAVADALCDDNPKELLR